MSDAPHVSPGVPFEAELRWLVRLHYLLAALTAATAPLGAYLFYEGWSLLHDPTSARPHDGPAIFDPLVWGATWAMVGGVLATLSLLHGAILWYVGRLIATRRRRLFCLVFSIFDLTYIPVGAALSLFAIVVLTRPEVKAQFSNSELRTPNSALKTAATGSRRPADRH